MRLGLELIVIGSGGHAKVVISTLLASGWGIHAVYDDDSKKWGRSIMGFPISGPITRLEEQDGMPVVIAIGDPRVRQHIVERYSRDWMPVIHPRAVVDATVKIGVGTVVFAGAVIQPDVVIGDHAIINTSANVDHECIVDDYAHIGPGVHMAANVHVHQGAFLGTGSQVIPSINIGANSMVGAGSSVIRDIPSNVTAVGCPAKVIKIHTM